MPISNPGCHLHFWPDYKSEVPTTHPWVQLICQRLTELRKPVYSLDCWFITKDTKGYPPMATWSDRRARYEAQSFHALSRHASPHLPVLTNPEALQTPSFWGLMGASLHRHNWLKHWPLVTELNLSLLPSPEVRKWDCKFQPSHVLAGFPANQPPSLGAVQKAPY